MGRNPAYKLVVFLSSLLLIAILNIPLILAQEGEASPTPTLLPTETPTEVPSETPTETLSPTLTEAPTETPTLEPTATPVAETVEPQPPSETPVEPGTLTPTSPIETATAAATPTEPFSSETPTATATFAASATPEALPTEPPLTPIFTDNFDQGEGLLWTLGSGWSFVPSEGGQALQGTISGESVAFANNNVYNAAVEARVQINAGEARLSTRVSAAGSYSAALGLDGTVALYRGETLLGSATIAPLTTGTWHTLRLSAFEDVLRVTIDGVEVIALRDAIPLPGGAAAFSGRNFEPATLLVDDFALWIENEAQGQVTETPSLTPSATSVHIPDPEEGLALVFSQSFDGQFAPYYQLYGAFWSFVPSAGNFALSVSQDEVITQITHKRPANVILEAKYFITGGKARLYTRQSTSGSYMAELGETGVLSLYRNSQLLLSHHINAFMPNQWHTLRLSTLENIVRVYVDGVEIGAVIDQMPLPEGKVGFAASTLNGNALLVDDLRLWIEETEVATRDDITQQIAGQPAITFSVNPAPSYTTFFSAQDAMGFTSGLEPLVLSELSAEGNNPIYIPNPVINVFNAKWSPDGTQIVFTCSVPGSSYDICVINEDGTNLRNLTNSPNHLDQGPVWSPDGLQIAFSSHRVNGIDPPMGIWTVNVNSPTNPQLLVVAAGQAVWSAEFYVWDYESPNANGGIFRLTQQGLTEPVILSNDPELDSVITNNVGDIHVGAFSVNNLNQIAFDYAYTDVNEDPHYGIGLLNTDGSISILQSDCAGRPVFAPYDTLLAFMSEELPQCVNPGRVHIIDRDGVMIWPDFVTLDGYGGFDWHEKAQQISATATAAAQQTVTAQAQATVTATVTVTPVSSCEMPEPLSYHFIQGGGLLAHEDAGGPNYGHGYSMHVAINPSLVYARALTGKPSTAFWDSSKPNTISTADNILVNALNISFVWLPALSRTAVHGQPYLIAIPAIVPRDSGDVTVLTSYGTDTFSFTNTTGYGFVRELNTGAVIALQPKGVRALLRCNIFSPILNVPYTFVTTYPAFFE